MTSIKISTSFKKNAILLFFVFITLCSSYSQNAWSYVGTPYTNWTYDPFTLQVQTPNEWPIVAKENYYYVAPDDPNATDNVQTGELIGEYGRYGYPDRPRATIPSNGWIGDTYIEGTIIWLKGGTYTSSNFYGTWAPEFQGTSVKPIWLYGDPDDKPVFTGPRITLVRGSHVIMENLQWIGGNTSNNVLSLTRDRPGATHHVTLRNLRFEDLSYIGGGGAIVALTGNDNAEGAELYDVVAYKNIFKNCGGGFDWSTDDGDHHGYKVHGTLGGNQVYRIWIIDNEAIKGDGPDPVDGLFKSLSGNFVQVGDQIVTSGGNHHVFVAGNYQEFARQALGWTKRSSDVIFSTNYCTDTYALAGGNGQSYGHQYDLGDYNWWVNNVGTRSSTGWQHTANDDMTGPLFIVGNLFFNNKNGESDDNWRLCSGVTLFSKYGEHYFVNNVFDNSCHGIWAKTNRHTSNAKLHIYNNIFTNITSALDPTSKAVTVDISGGMSFFMGNNLFDSYDNDVLVDNTSYSTLDNLNTQTWASSNIVGDPLYVDSDSGDFNTNAGSPAIDNGTQSYNNGDQDVYKRYIDRYTNDPDYPGNPQDYWPKDYLNNNRVAGANIDIGPYEYNSVLAVDENDSEFDSSVSIAPNPAKDVFIINLGNENETLDRVCVYNNVGQRMKMTTTPKVDIRDIADGVYYVKIIAVSGKVTTKKIIKF